MRAKPCPSVDDLLRFTAGDLAERDAAKVQSHLRDCSACISHLRGWDETLEAYRRHAPATADTLPRWEGFEQALRREEDAWQRDRVTRGRRQWAAVAAIAATVLGAAWFWQRSEVVLNAEEVITRAVRQERVNPSFSAAAIWIRETGAAAVSATESGADVRTIGDSYSASEVVSNRGRVAQELSTRLIAYGFNWAVPLSAQPLQRWRAAVGHPEDRILLINPALLKVSTTTAAGTIRLAEIVVRQHTYEPVSQHWRFADGFEVELTSVKPDERPLVVPPMVAATAHETVKPAARTIDIEAVELDLRTTLQRLGAPVGSALTIRHARGTIRVEGKVEIAEMARQIAAFARARHVVDARVTVESVPADRDVAVSSDLRAWLDQALPSDDVRETFVGRTSELLSRLKISVSALDELGRRYTNDRTAALSPDAQRMLADLAEAQYGEVTSGYEALERQLAPLIGTVSRPVMSTGLPDNWRRGGVAAKQAVDRLTDGLATVFAPAAAKETPPAFERRARDMLRPTLEALAVKIAGQS